MAAIRVRQDVWKLNEWDPTLLWYAKGIAKMQTRPIQDPTSWRYQAAIHDYISGADPLARPSDVLPSGADQQRFWAQCQHNSWFFLSWHRMYLIYFEQIVAAAVVEAGGPPGWTLPYWNYSDGSNPNARRLPPTFVADKMPDGTPNPLLVADRERGNDEGIVADDQDVDIRTCLIDPAFVADPIGGDPGFGGAETKFNHSGGAFGKLEQTPHGNMHMAVGGWMGSFNTAGLDPIFWLHHANIDRLWSVWRKRDAGNTNPTDPKWLTSVTFEFHDSNKNIVSFTSSQVVDTTAPPLSYMYEDESDPLGAVPAAPTALRRPAMKRKVIPEMVGATEESVMLGGAPTTTRLAANPPTGPARMASELGAGPPKIHLNFENITGSGQTYSVYLNLPPNSDPASNPDLHVGDLPMFGLKEASRSDQSHPGSGLHYALEISDVVNKLQAKGDWDPKNIRVTLVPKNRSRGNKTTLAPEARDEIRVGRISLYYA